MIHPHHIASPRSLTGYAFNPSAQTLGFCGLLCSRIQRNAWSCLFPDFLEITIDLLLAGDPIPPISEEKVISDLGEDLPNHHHQPQIRQC
jgi:hypothetical protein